MPPITVMLKPASGLCNMRCKYCFYVDEAKNRSIPSYGIMKTETLRAIMKRVLEFATGSCTFAFQGGEPTLAGLPFFREVVKLGAELNVHKANISYSLQTNGYMITDEWASFFSEHNFLIGVSLDGPKEHHDTNRIDADGKGTYGRVVQTIHILKKHDVPFNILTVITQQTAWHTRQIYNFFKKHELSYQQFIPCLSPLDGPPCNPAASLTAAGLETHLKTYFDCWYQDAIKGAQPYNRYLLNLLNIMCGIAPEACDMCGICNRQLVVEADGSVYPCDFYVLDQYRLGNLTTDSFETLEKKRDEIGFIQQSLQLKQTCKNCKWFFLCRGGCRRNWTTPNQGEYLKNEFCQAYFQFFEYAYPRLQRLAKLTLTRYTLNT